jgi:hypothetical protein
MNPRSIGFTMAFGALVLWGTARSEIADHQYYPFPAGKDPAVLVMPADLRGGAGSGQRRVA